MIHISESGSHEIAAIMPVMADAFDPAYGEAWTSAQCLSALAIPNCRLLIARSEDGVVAGFALSRWVLDEEELLMIGVKQDWQRQNVATALLQEILDRARSAGRGKIFLEVRDGNPAQIFYNKAGFASVGRRKQYYRGLGETRYDAITMIRPV